MKKIIKKNQLELFKSILIAIVSGFSVVVFQQMFFKSNIDYELRKEVLKDNYEYYVALQNFTDLNNYTVIVFEEITEQPIINFYIDEKTRDTVRIDTTLSKTKSEKLLELPSIAVDSITQKKWFIDKNYIIENRNKIDQELYLDFKEIVRIVKKNPWPMETSRDNLEKNIWNNREFVQNWFERNLLLHYKINEYIKIK